MGKIANRQPLVFNERGQLSQGTIVKRVNANRAIGLAAQQTLGL